MPKKQHGRFRKPAPDKPKPHTAVMSAVRERCTCGELMTAPVHGPKVRRVRLVFPPITAPGTALIQAGIDPDTAKHRNLVTRSLGWSWVNQVDPGVWNVRPPREWGTHISIDATINDGKLEAHVSVEWP